MTDTSHTHMYIYIQFVACANISFLFCYQLISYCGCKQHIYPGSLVGIFNLFHFLAIMNDDAVMFWSKFCGCMSLFHLGISRSGIIVT